MKLVSIYAIVFCFLIAWGGCAATNRQVKVMRYSLEDFAPTKISKVEILRTKPVTKSYTEIGELSLRVGNSNRETPPIKLKEKAAQLGADAIILMGERSTGSVDMPIGESYVTIDLRYLYGIAIKYE